MRSIGKRLRRFVTLAMLAVFAYAVQPGTMAMGLMPVPACAHAATVASVPSSAPYAFEVQNNGCCHGMAVCPGMLSCHGISVQAAYIPASFSCGRASVPSGLPRIPTGILLAPSAPPPIV